MMRGPKPEKVDRQVVISTVSEIAPFVSRVRSSAAKAVKALMHLTASEADGLEVLRQIKYYKIGRHPLEDRPMNLVEQVNQTWTCLVSLKAAEFLLGRHPDVGGFQLNLGNKGGADILSVSPDRVAAEGFAAVSSDSNKKLKKDLKKLERQHPKAQARYVFFAAPGVKHERQPARELLPGIEVWGIVV